ncbi:MAG: 50S ribosomal protein L11 [Nanoarchaeota archaeon]|nr:50S ribosomal protein L11 [Nanoarchaeota archaeon]
MAKQKIELMIEGGKATPAPPLGPALGQLKMNVGEVINQINDKTQSFKGMKVPVILIVDDETKEFEIEVGTPPASQLIKKELGIEKGSGEPNKNKVANAAIEQLIKIAQMKKDSMFAKNLKGAVKCIAGSLNAMGILIEGKISPEFNKDLDSGVYDKEIQEEKIEVNPEKKAKLKEQLSQIQEELQKELEKKQAEEEAEKAAAAPAEEEKKEGEEEEKKEGEEGKEEEKKEGEGKEEGKKEEKEEKKEEKKK